ncbi:Secreted protein [Frankia sp. AiPs1]|uniref:hypothetical protein n=1 Tax=Frankia sp. AiPa1 TaxID=573492 RepID=UPI00202B6D9E|nr:hypothetical protein [Frankia sp. AiPa1]MCL9760970.1 hypothetical protein [Frankia sp. AiPa1]
MLPARWSVRPRAARRPVAAVGMVAMTLAAAAACGADTTGATSTATARARVPVTAAATVPTTTPTGGMTRMDDAMPGMDHGAPGTAGMAGMAGMAAGGATAGGAEASGDGLQAQVGGLTLVTAANRYAAGWPIELRFQLRDAAGRPITRFVPEQDAFMHLYLVRSDLVGFQHVHPLMAPDGTWTANLASSQSGLYRVYTSFTAVVAGRDRAFVLSVPIAVPGPATPVPLPAPSSTAMVDGYTLRLATPHGAPKFGTSTPLTVTVTRGGRPVTDLEPYLASFAHLSAFHERDLAFAHLHPIGSGATGPGATGGGGPTLTFAAELPRAGAWRVYLQFRAEGELHTAALTLMVH